ncbi:anti-sigma factor family protein [Hyalangium gracile]|uniref:anti-sigma factor family protein n=1 Tax=Hyalangium gracile TaxID=394092 RepID=UPI001CCB69DF|nr:zf-HC2 domain-containing protein [Hyalangium gracile]
MSACQDQEELLTLHAAGALEPDEEARLREHLASCQACRSEAESTAKLLGAVALPPPSPAMRDVAEALPRRALGAWRREQVRKALRARTVGAVLAAAAVVLLVVNPSLHHQGTPGVTPSPVAASTVSETQADFEQWASSDPLGDALELASAEEDFEDTEDWADPDSSASELFFDDL